MVKKHNILWKPVIYTGVLFKVTTVKFGGGTIEEEVDKVHNNWICKGGRNSAIRGASTSMHQPNKSSVSIVESLGHSKGEFWKKKNDSTTSP